MLRLLAVAGFLVLLLDPCGDEVAGAIEPGCQVRESITRLAVSVAAQTDAEVEMADDGE